VIDRAISASSGPTAFTAAAEPLTSSRVIFLPFVTNQVRVLSATDLVV